jgi:hypothetical protein
VTIASAASRAKRVVTIRNSDDRERGEPGEAGRHHQEQ